MKEGDIILSLKDVLLNKKIQKEINHDIFKTAKLKYSLDYDKLVKSLTSNFIKPTITIEDKNYLLEFLLFFGEDRGEYLLTVRLLSEDEEEMISGYLMIFDENLKLIKNVNDVWSYEEWKYI